MRVTQVPDSKESRDSISHDWLSRLADWGLLPLLVPNRLTDPAPYLDLMEPDLLILTGGDDVGATPERDATETALLDHALDRHLPTLGICRGMQLINLHFGGALTPVRGHAGSHHIVSMEPRWSRLYGETMDVNSYHDQGIAPGTLADGLVAFACDVDGNVEALHHRNRPVAAVMWHPERDVAVDGDRHLLYRLAKEKAFWA